VPDDYEPRPLLPLDPTTQVLPGESEGTLTPYDGYDGVVNPGIPADELVFADPDGETDAEDRIGSTPSGGASSDDTGTDGDSTSSSGGSSDGNRGQTTTTEAPADGEGEGADEDDGSTTTTQAEGL
jgi:hypothetical protein